MILLDVSCLLFMTGYKHRLSIRFIREASKILMVTVSATLKVCLITKTYPTKTKFAIKKYLKGMTFFTVERL